ncbi:hypothetical protein RB200_11800 [Streptomyces sp. PmtG]
MSALPTLLSGPRWAVVRLHRTALWGALAVAALAAAATLALRLGAEHTREGTYLGFSDSSTFLDQYLDKTSLALLLLPALIAAFVAGPVVGRELETGLDKFTLTQSVTPARWLAARLALSTGLAVGAGLAALGVFRLGGSDTVGTLSAREWIGRGTYEATGPVLIAYCVLAVGVGALTGGSWCAAPCSPPPPRAASPAPCSSPRAATAGTCTRRAPRPGPRPARTTGPVACPSTPSSWTGA